MQKLAQGCARGKLTEIELVDDAGVDATSGGCAVIIRSQTLCRTRPRLVDAEGEREPHPDDGYDRDGGRCGGLRR